VSRSFYHVVSQPTKEQPHKKFKKHIHKKIRQKTKKILDDYINGEKHITDLEQEAIYE
jgi:hypothetical protein